MGCAIVFITQRRKGAKAQRKGKDNFLIFFFAALRLCVIKLAAAEGAATISKSVRKWQELGDSNPRPSVLETDALPTELNSCTPLFSEEGCP